MIVVKTVLLVIGFVMLIKGADLFVSGSCAMARNFHVPTLIIGLTIVGLGTSAPELAVSTAAALQGSNEIALSNVIGSNIFNLLSVLGICACIHPLPVDRSALRRDFPFSILTTGALLLLIAGPAFSGGYMPFMSAGTVHDRGNHIRDGDSYHHGAEYTIGNFERISDHSLNLTEASHEISEKRILMSEQAVSELRTLGNAVNEIISLATTAYEKNDVTTAEKVEPLEQVIDLLTETIRLNHTGRLQTGECTLERGFVLADILNYYERISDHCSNIAVAVLESDADTYDPHEYLKQMRAKDNNRFSVLYEEYKERYAFR